ncbi:response regulator [Streptomyces puniciscabiei]|uniref:response regulator n=1 Tax=Streptomyces puniciscabiei TaxID=164348 RepID=UPI0037967629
MVVDRVRWTGPLYGVEVGKTRTRWPVRTYSRLVPGASGRVLVVDDNKVIRQLIRVNLELEGLEVVTAADGAECLDVVHQVRPDVVTLDVVMPRLDGLRTAARLRADPRTHHLPLAIVSACTQYEVDTGLDVGVDAFLAKPFEPAELVRLVKQLMERGDGSGGKGGHGGHRGGGGRGEGEGDEDGGGGSGGGADDGLADGVSDGVPGGIPSGG